MFRGAVNGLTRRLDALVSVAVVPGHSAAHQRLRVVGAASLVGDRAEIRKRASDQFAPERFKARPEAPIANALKAMTGDKVPTFATLGDWSVLYVLLNQDPPYQIDYYDAAQIAEQHNMLSVLEKEDPELLVWNPVFGVDNVPYWIRNPLIFTWAVKRYTYRLSAPTMREIAKARGREGEAAPTTS